MYKNIRPDFTKIKKPMAIILVDENQNLIEGLEIGLKETFRLIDENMTESELKSTFCLQFIDPYGDTIFSRLQIEALRDEFQRLFDKSEKSEDQEKLQTIIDFVSKAEKKYLNVKFLGD